MSRFCMGCRSLEFDTPLNRYDVYRALCCDANKPMMGSRRVVAVSSVGEPVQVERPVWCRRKDNNGN